MYAKLKVTKVLMLGLLAFLCFAGLASMINRTWMAEFDSRIIVSIQSLESPGLTDVMKFFTFIGSTQIVTVISICCFFLLYYFLHHRIELIFFLIIIAGTGALNLMLKLIFQRERPSLHRLIEATGFSFPSGHSMEAFSLYASIAFLLWRHLATRPRRTAVILICIGMILMIGISRIYLGVHYPSDVIGAYFASGFWFALFVWLYQWYMEYRYNKQMRKAT
ncbi:phosphatase PAP2 family protein [Paenibacillus aestuarii]|uniref:Phosphatase PAP2 family protein n=1 Tax=Paenibacillus aestuarii TaxID=516965 RepID=A0ABW0K734_9BACL|nr:phosphatase PAP2 family protein [Paenibacillus aestuarii]